MPGDEAVENNSKKVATLCQRNELLKRLGADVKSIEHFSEHLDLPGRAGTPGLRICSTIIVVGPHLDPGQIYQTSR